MSRVGQRKHDNAYADSIGGKGEDVHAVERRPLSESIEDVEGKIQRATSNLALVDSDMIQHVQQTIRDLESERRTLAARLEELSRPETPLARYYRSLEESEQFEQAWELVRDFRQVVAQGGYSVASMRRGLASMGLSVVPEVERVPFGLKAMCVLHGREILVALPGVSVDLAQSMLPWLNLTGEEVPIRPQIRKAAEISGFAGNRDLDARRFPMTIHRCRGHRLSVATHELL